MIKWAIGDQMFKKVLGDGLRHALMQVDRHILADSVDPDEQIPLLLSEADFGNVEVHVVNGILLEFLFLNWLLLPLFRRQAVEAVPFQAPVQIGTGEGWNGVFQRDQDIVKGQIASGAATHK